MINFLVQVDDDVEVLEAKLQSLQDLWTKREDDLQNDLELKACDLDETVIEVTGIK